MTVLTIRSHRRYAVRQPVTIGKDGCEPAGGLMIELSSEGCRVSNLARGSHAIGDAVTLELGELRMPGHIRWAHDGIVGVKLDNALFAAQLNDILARGRQGQDPLPRYGT